MREKREEQGQMRFAGGGKQLMMVTDGEQKSNRGGVMKMITETADPLPHWLPVLLMFLKLPKLFNFHILRLAAERETSKEEDRQGLRRSSVVLVRACSHFGRDGDGDREGDAPSACPAAASPFWFMLFFLLFFFLSLIGEEWPESFPEKALAAPSRASDGGGQRYDTDLWTQLQSSRTWS